MRLCPVKTNEMFMKCQDQAINLNWRQSNAARVLLGTPTVAHHAAHCWERWFFILSIKDRHCAIAWARRVKSRSLDAISLISISLLSSRLSLDLPRSYYIEVIGLKSYVHICMSQSWYILRPSYRHCCNHANNIRQTAAHYVKFMKLLIM